jgi:hypothetical protein
MRRANERLQHILQHGELQRQHEEEVARTDKPEGEEGVAPMQTPDADKAVYRDLTQEHLEAKEPDFEAMHLSPTRASRDNMTERAKCAVGSWSCMSACVVVCVVADGLRLLCLLRRQVHPAALVVRGAAVAEAGGGARVSERLHHLRRCGVCM